MSLDRSLKSASSLVRHRNVLTRAERLDRLKEAEKWDEKKSPLGLPKVANRKVETAKGGKEATEEGATPVAGAAAPAAAAPAGKAGAAPAATKGAPAAKGAAPAAKAAAPAAGAKKK